MPYYIYIVTTRGQATMKSVDLVSEFGKFKDAKTEVKRLRAGKPLDDASAYKIIFADNKAEAEKKLTEVREEPIAREWEK